MAQEGREAWRAVPVFRFPAEPDAKLSWKSRLTMGRGRGQGGRGLRLGFGRGSEGLREVGEERWTEGRGGGRRKKRKKREKEGKTGRKTEADQF